MRQAVAAGGPASAAALAAVAAIALAGCGGSSNKQLSYSAFVSKANDLCRTGQAETDKAADVKQAGAIAEKYVKKFKELKPPDQLKAAYDRFISISEQQVVAAKRGDAAIVQRLNTSSDAAASQMGATDCVSK